MVATIGGQLRLARSGQLVISPGRPPSGRRIQPPKDVEQRGFSRAGRPQYDNELARRDVEIERAQSMHGGLPAAVSLAKTASDENRLALLRLIGGCEWCAISPAEARHAGSYCPARSARLLKASSLDDVLPPAMALLPVIS